MTISGKHILQLLFYVGILKVCISYNIDVSHARVLIGPKDSLFGYTTVFQRTPEGYKLIVGAPKGNSDIRNGTGVTFRCDVSGSPNCTQEYTIRDKNYPDIAVSGAWFNDHEMYGSFITQTDNNTLVNEARFANGPYFILRQSCAYKSLQLRIQNAPGNVVLNSSVCAPRYNDLSYENRGYPFLIGRCVMDGQVIRPLWMRKYIGKINTNSGINKAIFWNGMGQSGLSGDSLSDGSVVLGVPGFMEWRGGFVVLKTPYGAAESFETGISIPGFSYIGYSLVSGKFLDKGKLCFATGGPREESGKVFVYQYTLKEENVTLLQTLEGTQTGSYFGATLCAVDVNGDGLDDLLVGAPFHIAVDKSNDNSKKVHVDEGRVTVFLNVRGAGPGLTLQKSIVLEGSNECHARFGTAITNIRDINNDGYNDVTIGAPYEDGGRGAVYIYHGGKGGLKPEVKQRIMGRVINDTVTSFGWSISKPEDVDNNKYPDFTVGGYLSDSAVILRTRPVVNVQVTMETDLQLIIRDMSLCPIGLDSDRCFRLKLCFRYNGPSLPRQLNFNYTLSVDTYFAKGQKRVHLNSTQGLTDTVSAVVTADSQTGMCKEYQAMSIEERRELDPFTVVRLEAWYQLQQPADPTSDIQPISNQEQPDKIVKDISFELDCGNDDQCWSDLVLEVSSRIKHENDDVIRKKLKKDIVINATETVILDIGVRNDGEDAFATVIYVTWTGSVTLQMTEDTLKQPVICNEDPTELDFDSKRIDCTVIRPVKEGSDFGVIMYFTANDVLTDLSSVDFSVTIESGSNETNPFDNVANVTAKVWIDAQTKIDGCVHSKWNPSQEKHTAFPALERKSDPEEKVISQRDNDKTIVKLLHMYFITNDGPSFLPTTVVTVKLPYYMLSSGTDKAGGDSIVTSATVELLQEGASKVKCLSGPEREALRQNKTTTPPLTKPSGSGETQPSLTTPSGSGKTTGSFLSSIVPSKLVQGPNNIIQEGKNRVLVMDCVDYMCEEYVCTLQHLTPGVSTIVKVKVQVPARNLPLYDEQDIDYLMYRSKATVKQPSHPLLYPWKDNMVSKHISTKIYPAAMHAAPIQIWILILSVIAGIIVLALVLLVLYKLGFFKREKKEELKKLQKRNSLRQLQPDSATVSATDSATNSGTDCATNSGTDSATNSGTDSAIMSATDSATNGGTDCGTDSARDSATNSGNGSTTLEK